MEKDSYSLEELQNIEAYSYEVVESDEVLDIRDWIKRYPDKHILLKFVEERGIDNYYTLLCTADDIRGLSHYENVKGNLDNERLCYTSGRNKQDNSGGVWVLNNSD